MYGEREEGLPEAITLAENIESEHTEKGDEHDRHCARRPEERPPGEVSHIASWLEIMMGGREKSFQNAYKMLTFSYPRPANGIPVAITVINATLASSGRFAM